MFSGTGGHTDKIRSLVFPDLEGHLLTILHGIADLDLFVPDPAGDPPVMPGESF